VFEKKQDVADLALLAHLDELLLQVQSGRVVERAELKNGDHFSSYYFILFRRIGRVG